MKGGCSHCIRHPADRWRHFDPPKGGTWLALVPCRVKSKKKIKLCTLRRCKWSALRPFHTFKVPEDSTASGVALSRNTTPTLIDFAEAGRRQLIGRRWLAGPPHVSGPVAPRQTFRLGENVKLDCPIRAIPAPILEWSKVSPNLLTFHPI